MRYIFHQIGDLAIFPHLALWKWLGVGLAALLMATLGDINSLWAATNGALAQTTGSTNWQGWFANLDGLMSSLFANLWSFAPIWAATTVSNKESGELFREGERTLLRKLAQPYPEGISKNFFNSAPGEAELEQNPTEAKAIFNHMSRQRTAKIKENLLGEIERLSQWRRPQHQKLNPENIIDFLILHYWFGVGYRRLGKIYGITGVRVRYLEARTLRLMRHPLIEIIKDVNETGHRPAPLIDYVSILSEKGFAELMDMMRSDPVIRDHILVDLLEEGQRFEELTEKEQKIVRELEALEAIKPESSAGTVQQSLLESLRSKLNELNKGGYSWNEIANALNVSDATLLKIRTGKAEVHLKTVKRLLTALEGRDWPISLPLYPLEMLHTKLQEAINAGHTQKEIAHEAGVSHLTIFYVIHGKRGVTHAMRKQILDALERLERQGAEIEHDKNDRRVNLSDKINYSDDIKSAYEKSKIERLLENLNHFPESGLQIQRVNVRKEYDMDSRKIYEINFISSAGEILAPAIALKIYEPFLESIKTMETYANKSAKTANELAKENSDIVPRGAKKLIGKDPSTGKRLVALRKEYITGSNIEDMIRAVASSEERHRLAVKGLNAYLVMYKALGYLIDDAEPENIVIGAITEQAKIIDFEAPTKKMKEPELLELLQDNWKFIFTSEDKFLEAFGEAATQVYGQEASRFLEKAGVLPYYMERLQEHLYELKPHLAVLKYLLTIFDEADEARERYIFTMEDNVTKMIEVYGKVESFLYKHGLPAKLQADIQDYLGNALNPITLFFPLSVQLEKDKRVIPDLEELIQKLKVFKQSLFQQINRIEEILETYTFTQPEKEYYEERALGEMLRIFPTLIPVSLEYLASEFPDITIERIKELLKSTVFYAIAGGMEKDKTATYVKPESLGAAVGKIINEDDSEGFLLSPSPLRGKGGDEVESALRREIREALEKAIPGVKTDLLSSAELKERISELPDDHKDLANLWAMVRLADFFRDENSERWGRQTSPIENKKEQLPRILHYMTGDELSELVKLSDNLYEWPQQADGETFALFAKKLFGMQGALQVMSFEETFSAFRGLTGFISPGIEITQETEDVLLEAWKYGTDLPGQLMKASLIRTREFVSKNAAWSGVRLFDVSNISEDTLTQMWTNIKMVKGKIAIGLMTDKAVLGKDDIENIKKSLRSRWKNMSEQNRPDFDKMLKDVHFGEIIVTAADLMKNEHAESPLVEINPDVLYKVTRDKAKNLFGNTGQIPVQLFTPNPFRFKLSWKEEALQILAIVTAIQILEIGNKTEDTIRQIIAASKQA